MRQGERQEILGDEPEEPTALDGVLSVIVNVYIEPITKRYMIILAYIYIYIYIYI